MNRKFLEELGLENEAIEKIMKEHGKTIQELKPAKEELEGLQSEKSNLENQLSELQGTLESNQEKLNSVDELEKQVKTYKLKNLKTSIANQIGIPLDLADRLNGETEDELKEDAEKMAGFVNKKQPLPLKPTEPPVDDKDAGLKQMLGNINK